MSPIHPTIATATQGLDTAAKLGNQKLAFVMTGLTCLLVGEMLYERLTHLQKLQLERAGQDRERRSSWPGDRRL